MKDIIMKTYINDREVQYEIIRKNVKNLTLRIKSDGRIVVTANNRVSNKQIEEFIKQKGDWILNKLDAVNHKIRIGKGSVKLQNNQKISLLGVEHTIYIHRTLNNLVRLDGNTIHIYCRDIMNETLVERIFNEWLATYTKETFENILYISLQKCIPYNIKMPTLKIRSMKTRWGSCAVEKGIITINSHLIHTPEDCIEFVILHELIHFIHANHSKDFYNSLSFVLPDHKTRNKLLSKYSLS